MSIGEMVRRGTFRLADRVRGGGTSRVIRELAADFADSGLAKRRREKRLRLLLDHAVRTTERYREYPTGMPLHDFPMVSKAQLRDRQTAHLSSAFEFRRLGSVSTSGSYGTPMRFPVTAAKRLRQRGQIIFFNGWMGYRPGDRYAYLVCSSSRRHAARLRNEVHLDPRRLDREWLEQAAERIRASGVRFLVGYPSALEGLAEHLARSGEVGAAPLCEGAVTMAEPLHPVTAQVIRQTLAATVLSRYAAWELGVLAHQRTTGGPHLPNRTDFVIELLDREDERPVEPGEPGRVVVTDLFSHAMPLIRYDTGDVAVADEAGQLVRIDGRAVESVTDAQGRVVLPFALSRALADLAAIRQFQFVQRGPGRYKVRIVPGAEVPEGEITRRYRDILGADAEVEIEEVDQIPPLPSGKRPYVLREGG